MAPLGGTSPREDPRTKPALVEAMVAFGIDGRAEDPGVDVTDPEAVTAYVAEAHAGFEGLYEALPNELPDDGEEIAWESRTVAAGDDHEIGLRIYRPARVDGALPGLIYFHGGGMAILSAHNRVHRRWCEDLAASGMVVVGVDFRNAYGPASLNPFPIGREDCFAAFTWVDEHRAELGIGNLVLQGESGGANLALSTTLAAKRRGVSDRIDGVYAMVPYISGAYGWDEEKRRRELPSLVENDGYFMSCGAAAGLAAAYDPGGRSAEDPLAWPYFVDEEELTGMPPHVISVNEVDPLRDEGVAYFHKLQRAGVPSRGRINLGLTHAAEMVFRQALAPDYFGAIGDINAFAKYL